MKFSAIIPIMFFTIRALFLILITCILIPLKIYGNVVGSDIQNFNPVSSGLDFVTVHSAQTLRPGVVNFGTFFDYTLNSLAYSALSTSSNSQTFSEPNDKLLYSNLHLAVGILDWWDFGVSAGFINSQKIDNTEFLFSYGDTGLNDLILASKIRFYQGQSIRGAFVLGMDFDQIKNNPFRGSSSGPSINFDLVLDYKLSDRFLWALNVGYRLRQEGLPIPNTGVIPISDQWTYSTALSYLLNNKGSAIIGEIYGSVPQELTTTPTDRQISNLEVLLGYKWKSSLPFAIHSGIGTEIYHGLGSPDFRLYVGLNWRINDTSSNSSTNRPSDSQPIQRSGAPLLDSDNDGIPDNRDQCPNTEAFSQVNEQGCLKNGEANINLDSDNDGVRDEDDSCPNSPKGIQVNGFGCEIAPVE